MVGWLVGGVDGVPPFTMQGRDMVPRGRDL